MTFDNPQLLWAIPIALALVAWGSHGLWRRRRKLADLLGGEQTARHLTGMDLYRFPARRAALLAAAVVALGLALAEPHDADAGLVADGEPWDVIVAVDISRSMQANDIAPSRLGGAREAVDRVIEALPNHRLGLMLYAGEPYALTPPTPDHAIVRFFAGGIVPDLVSDNDEGTRIAEALGRTVALFAQQPRPSGGRAVVLVTDGDSPEADEEILSAAEALADQGIRVFPIGVGTTAGTGLTQPNRPGRWGGAIVDERGVPVVSRREDELLRRVASAGNGSYAAASSESEMADQLGELVLLPSGGSGSQGSWLRRLDTAFWLGALAFSLLIAEALGRLNAARRPPRHALRRE